MSDALISTAKVPEDRLFRLDGQVALVTGASGGIGRAVAKLFSAQGAKVAVHYHSDSVSAEAVVSEIRDSGGNAEAFKADIGDLAAVGEMNREIISKLGPVAILVSNAGVSSVLPFMECSLDEWDQIVRTNLYGFFNCVRTFTPSMMERKSGRIIATGSIGAEAAPPGEVTFVLSAATKGGIMAMVRPLATEFGPFGITVNAVSPGTILSGMAERDAGADLYGRILESVRLVPLGRHGRPEDIAHAMLFLASQEGSWITGQTLSVNGGYFYR